MPCRPPLPQATALALVVLALAVPSPADADPRDRVVGPSDRTGLALTLYQDDSALVRDRRAVSLDKGPAELVWEGVARQAQTSSGILSGAGVAVRSQRFTLDGASSDGMLASAVGREVTVVWADGSREEKARVLAAGTPPLFEVGGKVVAGQPARIVYDQDVAGLRTGPAFAAEVDASAPGKRDLELAYMTGGVGWQADYVAELPPGGDQVTLSGWATLTNASGVDFPNAQVGVVAGRTGRVADGRRNLTMAAASAAPEHEALGPYQLFRLPQPVSLLSGERTQAVLLPPTAVKVSRELVLEPLPTHAWRSHYGEPLRQNPVALLRLDNSRASGLGRPLPAGTLRLYQRDRDGSLVYLGEDRLPATPDRGSARVAIGQAFDVTAKRIQTDFQHVSAEVSEAAYEVDLANAGDKPANVTVRENFGADWLVLEESEPHHRDDATSASWLVRVPAKGDTVLKYRVRVKG